MSLTDMFNKQSFNKTLVMNEPMDSRLDQTATKLVGQPITRIEGHLKVAGRAPYTAEKHFPKLCYGVMVGATVGHGKVKKVHKDSALSVSGVLAVIHDEQFLRNPQQGGVKKAPIQTATEVFYHGQPVALVVAETLEAAQEGAWALKIDYSNDEKHGQFDFEQQKHNTKPIDWSTDKSDNIGHPEKQLAKSEVKIDVTYTTPSQSNMPMEPHASLAYWEGDKLVLHTSNQMIGSSKLQLVDALKISGDDLHMLSPYIGGGFGSKLGIAPETVMAALAAKELNRPVLVTMTRQQVMETTVRRTNTEQRVAIGADRDGKIHTIIHNSIVTNLPSETFFEPVAVSTHFLYQGENRQIKYDMARMNQVLAGSMRAPGEAVGQLALECAMDELAHELNICPIELRKRNEPDQDPSKKVPFTTRKLLNCMERGAAEFGWDKRPQQPGTIRDGDWLVGYGMAVAARSNELKHSKARVKLLPSDNTIGVKAVIETDMTDIGTGSYTIFAQVVADLLGLPLDAVEVKLGDSDLPPAAGSGGSWGASSAGSAIYLACEALREQIAKVSGLHNDTLKLKDGRIYRHGTHDTSIVENITEQGTKLVENLADKTGLDANKVPFITTESAQHPDWQKSDVSWSLADFLKVQAPEGMSGEGEISPGKTKLDYRHASYGAQFVEVGVHHVTGEIRVRRMVGVFSAGRILNEKTARSQCFGGMVFSIGSALMEKIEHDKNNGRLCNHDLAEYHVPINADVPNLEVIFLPEADIYANPLHSKGIGELALSGAGAAIANAVFNATGIRVRDYPLTLDKLLYQLPLLS